MKDIKEQYKQETKGRVYSEEFESTSYTDEYVRWLEQKIAKNTEIIGSVSGTLKSSITFEDKLIAGNSYKVVLSNKSDAVIIDEKGRKTHFSRLWFD